MFGRKLVKENRQIILTDDNFRKEVLENRKPVLVEVGADWCGATHIIRPIIRRMTLKYNGQIKFGKLNMDTSKKTALALGATTVPVLLVFNNGQIVDNITGTFSNSDLERVINSILQK